MKFALCHPDRQRIARGYCSACYQRWNYQQKRKAGLPYWRAAKRTVQGWANLTAINTRYRKRNWHKFIEWNRAQKARLLEQYGAYPSLDTTARFKWLMAKAKKKPRNKRKPPVKPKGKPGNPGDHTYCTRT